MRGVDHSNEVFAALRERGIEVVSRGGLRSIASPPLHSAVLAGDVVEEKAL